VKYRTIVVDPPKRNPAGGLYVESPGGYERDAGTTFGLLTIRKHRHEFVRVKTPLYSGNKKRCCHCGMTPHQIRKQARR